MVNCITRYSKATGSLEWPCKYLSREESVYEYEVSDNLSLPSFKSLKEDKKEYFRLIVSPKKEDGINFKALAEKVIEELKEYNNNERNFHYAYFLHNDTEHKHIHFLILPFSSENSLFERCEKAEPIKINPHFAVNILNVKLNEYIKGIQGEITEEEVRIDRLNSIHKNNAVELDYLIEKSTDRNIKDGFYNYFSIDKRKDFSNEDKAFMLARLKHLESIGFAKNINGSVFVRDNLAWSLVALNKILKHSKRLEKCDIPIEKIQLKTVKTDNLKRIISRVVDMKRRQVSVLCQNMQDEYCLMNQKLVSDTKDRELLNREAESEIDMSFDDDEGAV